MEPPPLKPCLILGAGFTCAFSTDAPAMGNLLARAKARGVYKPETDHKALGALAEKYFGSATQPNIEDLASFLLIDLGADPEKEKELRGLAYDQLLQIIVETLGNHIHGPAMNRPPTDVFVKVGAFAAKHGVPVITFNYDLVFDQLLLGTQLWSPIDGYGVRIPLAYPSGSPLTGEVLENNERIRRTGSRFGRISNTVLIKLHGSLNWGTRYVPPASSEYTVELGFAGSVGEAGVPLLWSVANSISGYNLGSAFSVPLFWRPFIVPPNIGKVPPDSSQKFLREIWYLARCAIASCDEVHILGYSLPPSDFEADALFREGIFAPPRRWHKRRVIVVNKDPAVFQRFLRYTRPGVVDVEPGESDNVADYLKVFLARQEGSAVPMNNSPSTT